MLTSLSLLSSLCTEEVGVFCITELDLNDIFGVDFDLFVNYLELTIITWYGKKNYFIEGFDQTGNNK